ncbi:MAG TPA: homoserine kinase [Spirochaetales bacterium]|nr:homoserine kinase [Spirochaetales bacterium]
MNMQEVLTIRVPATSANIGPGFDTLGLALSLYNEFEVSCASTWRVEGCDPAYCTDDNLFLRSYRYGREQLGLEAFPIHVRIRSKIPVARGLGSSAALSVGGLVAALLLGNKDADVRWQADKAVFGPRAVQFLLDVATAVEGHPDNAVPAVCGGFCTAFVSDTPVVQQAVVQPEGARVRRVVASRNSIPSSWRFHAIIPPFELETKRARAVLPATLSRTDAVFNIARAVMVSQAVLKKDAQLLGLSCDDKLHQPYRKALIPGYEEVKEACINYGAGAFWLSGSGPTLMAMTVGPAKSREFSAQIDSFLTNFHANTETHGTEMRVHEAAVGLHNGPGVQWIHCCLRPDNQGVVCVQHSK